MAAIATVNLHRMTDATGLKKVEMSDSERQGKIRKAAAKAFQIRPSMLIHNVSSALANDREEAVKLIQLQARERMYYPHRLQRNLIIQRLKYESAVMLGTLRLLNFLLIFVFLSMALGLSDSTGVKGGIYTTLVSYFDADQVKEVKEMDDALNVFHQISERSRSLTLLSSRYWQEDNGSLELLRGTRAFTQPVLQSHAHPKVDGDSFTVIVWLEALEQFRDGYILRKKADGFRNGAEGLSCWAWHLDLHHGPALHYGAHDFFDWHAHQDPSAPPQIQVGLTVEQWHDAVEIGQFSLLTMIVTRTDVTFYHDLEKVGTVALPRALTDCHNSYGVLLGSAGLVMGQMRFYPEALSPEAIEEIYEHGATLVEISTGFAPHAPDTNELEAVGEALQQRLDTLEKQLEVLGRQNAHRSLVSSAQSTTNLAVALNAWDTLNIELGLDARNASPPLAYGKLDVSSATEADPVNEGRRYYSLIGPPADVGPPPLEAEPRYFDPATFPSWLGTGVTFTFWMQYKAEGFILYANKEGADHAHQCWNIWLEDDAILFQADPDVMPVPLYVRAFLEDMRYSWYPNGVWRHVAWQLVPGSNQFRLYLDGELAYQTVLEMDVAAMDCADERKVVAVGHRFPYHNYPFRGELADLRMYVGGDLSAEEIHAIAHAPKTEAIGVEKECVRPHEGLLHDAVWTDMYGHDCRWYYQNKEEEPALCSEPEARRNCPIACQSVQECWKPLPKYDVTVLWDRIRRLKVESGSKGTICLGDSLEPAAVVAECAEWRRAAMEASGGRLDHHHDLEKYLLAQLGGVGRRLNLTSCEELAAAIDPECSFDMQRVERFTETLRERGGDYTVAFWVKSTGTREALDELSRFIPQLAFYSSLSPPRHNLLTMASKSRYGDVLFESACEHDSETVHLKRVDQSGWTMVAIVRRAHGVEQRERKNIVFTDEKMEEEATGTWRQCLHEGPFFKAIEVSQDMLISPVFLVPVAEPLDVIQEEFYRIVKSMEIRSGPLRSSRDALAAKIPVAKTDYLPHGTLLAPPIIYQTRSRKVAECEVPFSTDFIGFEHHKVPLERCAGPRECSAEVLHAPESVMACTGPLDTSKDFFGLELIHLHGQDMYSDFLHTMMEAPFVWRPHRPAAPPPPSRRSLSAAEEGGGQGGEEDAGGHAVGVHGAGKVWSTADFVDSATEEVTINLIFYFPEYGITSVVNFHADMSKARDVQMSYDVHHFEIIQGGRLTLYLTVMYIGVVCQVFLFLDNVRDFRKCYQCYIRRKTTTRGIRSTLNDTQDLIMELFRQMRTPILDFCISALLIIYLAVRIPMKTNSHQRTTEVVGQLHDIPWGDSQVPMPVKVKTFFDTTVELLETVDEETSVNNFANVIMLCLLWRIVLGTSIHPRLNLLTGTISHALDDLWHTTILLVVVGSCFAAIGTWRFGSENPQFEDLTTTVFSELEFMLTGSFPHDWTSSIDLVVWTLMFTIINGVLVLNFLLAIIVEAYLNVREANEKNEIESEFFTDLYNSFIGMVWGPFVWGWPAPARLVEVLEREPSVLSVSFKHLHRSELFKSQHACTSFIMYYTEFDFLRWKTPAQSDFGHMVDTIEKRIAWLLQVPPMSHAERSVAEAVAPPERSDRLRTAVPHVRLEGKTDSSVLPELADGPDSPHVISLPTSPDGGSLASRKSGMFRKDGSALVPPPAVDNIDTAHIS